MWASYLTWVPQWLFICTLLIGLSRITWCRVCSSTEDKQETQETRSNNYNTQVIRKQKKEKLEWIEKMLDRWTSAGESGQIEVLCQNVIIFTPQKNHHEFWAVCWPECSLSSDCETRRVKRWPVCHKRLSNISLPMPPPPSPASVSPPLRFKWGATGETAPYAACMKPCRTLIIF